MRVESFRELNSFFRSVLDCVDSWYRLFLRSLSLLFSCTPVHFLLPFSADLVQARKVDRRQRLRAVDVPH